MTGDELKAWRTANGLYQADLADRLQAAGVAVEGLKLDQPTVSEMERGKLEVPDAVAQAISGGLVPPGDRQPRQRGSNGASASSSSKRGPRAAAAEPTPPAPEPEPAGEPAGDEPDAEPPPAAASSDGDALPPREPDRPPRVAPGPAGLVKFDAAARSQLEADLRKLFAGDVFLVPVEIVADDGTRQIMHQEAEIPGLAQLVSTFDEYDGRVIAMNADAMARAWAELAEQSPRVRRMLMAMTYGGAWRGVVAATLPVIYAIAVHHGLVPPILGGELAAPQQPANEPAAAPA